MQQSIMKVLLLLGLLALVSASPLQKRGVYKVERVTNPNFTGRNGPRALLKTLRKYRMPVPAHVIDAVQAQDIEWITKRNRMPIPVEHLDGVSAMEVEMISKRAGEQGTIQERARGRAKAKGNKGAGAAAGVAKGNGTAKAAANNTGLVTATPEQNDVEYLSPVNIGGQTLNLDFDSGSSDLWCFNTQLSAAATTGHTTFDPTKSKTFALMQGASFQISYGDGSGAAGNVGTDVVSVGGATVQKQAVELATAVSRSFVQDTANNGLLGLAFSKLNTIQPQPQKTFFDNVMNSLAEPLFTADLRPAAPGAYEFGRIDTSKFTGAMTWVPVNSAKGFWQFTSESFAVGTGAPQASTKGAQAIADTGTTLILADPKVAEAYYSQIEGAKNDQQAGGFTVPCNAQLPDLMLDVGGTMARVKGKDINFAPVDQTSKFHQWRLPYYTEVFANSHPAACFGGLQASPANNLQIYGDIFFKSQFVAFNGGNSSLGFAEHV